MHIINILYRQINMPDSIDALHNAHSTRESRQACALSRSHNCTTAAQTHTHANRDGKDATPSVSRTCPSTSQHTLTKPSQRVRVTWVGHRRRASESGWIAEFGSECRSPILTLFGTFIMNDRSCRHCRFRLRIVTTGLELCAVDLILARLFSRSRIQLQ